MKNKNLKANLIDDFNKDVKDNFSTPKTNYNKINYNTASSDDGRLSNNSPKDYNTLRESVWTSLVILY